jgi:hypothetical protein
MLRFVVVLSSPFMAMWSVVVLHTLGNLSDMTAGESLVAHGWSPNCYRGIIHHRGRSSSWNAHLLNKYVSAAPLPRSNGVSLKANDGINGDKNKKDPDAPKQWTDQTTPFEVVKYYARDEVTDEEIQALIDENEITTLQKLKFYASILGPVIRLGTMEELIANVNAALNRNKTKPTEVLAGELDFDNTCIDKEVLKSFASEAVSVSESEAAKLDRYPNFSLVLGPSGSGKTMFCLQELGNRVFRGAVIEKNVFRVHLTVNTLLNLLDDDDDDKKKKTIDLAGLLEKYVHDRVARLLSDYVTSTTAPPPIDLFLLVVLDEAGRTEFKPFFDTAAKIQKLVTALQDMKVYKFTKGVHVTVIGTALETSTKDVDSKRETVKFRMQPWSRKNFLALLIKLDRKNRSKVVGMVERFPIVDSLTTNARCAFYLADTMPSLLTVSEEELNLYVEASVANVARCYVQSNGLADLKNLEDKFVVAQEAFRALNQAMIQPDIALFPTFDHIEKPRLRAITQSLLDVNVEIRDGKPELMNSTYSVSMTPAIVVVLAELLCQIARISWNWQGCESTSALGEWKTMITNMKASDFTRASGIIYLQSPIPAGRAITRFTLPLVDRATVVLNGPLAKYADVIAPFRLVQTKFSKDTNKEMDLNFTEEIGKMGLTTTPGWRLQQAATSVLHKMWQRFLTSGSNEGSGQFVRLGSYDGRRCVYYPFDTLLSDYTPVYKAASFIIKEIREKDDKEPDMMAGLNDVLPDDIDDVPPGIDTVLPHDIDDVLPYKKDVEATTLIDEMHEKRIKILEDFSEEQPVTAVFATNVKSFVLKCPGITPFTISRDDVDWQGVLHQELPDHFKKDLRKHVEVRFIFFGR